MGDFFKLSVVEGLCDRKIGVAREWIQGLSNHVGSLTGVKHLSGLATIVPPVLLMVFVPLR